MDVASAVVSVRNAALAGCSLLHAGLDCDGRGGCDGCSRVWGRALVRRAPCCQRGNAVVQGIGVLFSLGDALSHLVTVVLESQNAKGLRVRECV